MRRGADVRRGEDRADERGRPLHGAGRSRDAVAGAGTAPGRSTGSRRAASGRAAWCWPAPRSRSARRCRSSSTTRCPTVVLTSATLSAGGAAGFRHSQERLGLDGREDAAARQPVRLPRAGRAAPVPRRCPTRRPCRPSSRRRCWRSSRSTSRGPRAGRSCCSPATRSCSGRPTSSGRGSTQHRYHAARARATACRRRSCWSSSAPRRGRCCSAWTASGRAWTCRARRCRT